MFCSAKRESMMLFTMAPMGWNLFLPDYHSKIIAASTPTDWQRSSKPFNLSSILFCWTVPQGLKNPCSPRLHPRKNPCSSPRPILHPSQTCWKQKSSRSVWETNPWNCLNMVRFEKGEIGKDEVSRMMELPVYATVPYDDEMRHSFQRDKAVPVMLRNTQAKSSIEIQKLAARLAGLPVNFDENKTHSGFFGSIFGFFARLFGGGKKSSPSGKGMEEMKVWLIILRLGVIDTHDYQQPQRLSTIRFVEWKHWKKRPCRIEGRVVLPRRVESIWCAHEHCHGKRRELGKRPSEDKVREDYSSRRQYPIDFTVGDYALIECFDVGGTSIRGAIIENEKILAKKIIPSTQAGFPSLVLLIKNLSTEIRGAAKKTSVECTVIGLPGPIQGNILLNSGPLGILSSISLESLIRAFPNPVKIENDLKLAVKAEFFLGYGKGLDSFYLLAISTGMGAGLVWNKTLVEGTMGEFGHMILDTYSGAPACVLDHKGCWFSFSSGKGIQMQTEKVFNHLISPEEVLLLRKRRW